MNGNPNSAGRIIGFVFAAIFLAAFNITSVFSARAGGDASGPELRLQSEDTNTPTVSPTPTRTPTRTPTLVSGVLSCNTVVAGVTCTNYGTYLDYNININVTGLTGGATASNITIGTYKRSTSGGYMGMMSNFVHSETSIYPNNTVFSMVRIKPFDAAKVDYASFTSGPGTCVYLTNSTNSWRWIAGTGGWPNTLSVRGNVDWPITGYSIVGHIYLYSNQNFVTVTPTSTRTPTFTPTTSPTATPTNTSEPNYGGNGECWVSENSWPFYSVGYVIDRNTIPVSFGWDESIHAAAQTWNDVDPSHYWFYFSYSSNNSISAGQTWDPNAAAETSPNPIFIWWDISEKSTIINSNVEWDTNNTPIPGNEDSNGSTTTANIQNVMTHEFGHWLALDDIDEDNGDCGHVTMWYTVVRYGEIKKITLAIADENAINWQYP